MGGLLEGLGRQSQDPNSSDGSLGGLGSILGGLGGAIGGASTGSILSGGLGDLIDRFHQAGRGDKADSWVNDGDNAPVDASDLEEVLGDDTIAELTQKTGLSRAELLERLSKTLPDAVNQMRPEARIPPKAEANRLA